MKRLIFTRHAKSSWEYDVTDKKRPLKGRGITDAKLVSQEFISKKIKVDKIFSSPANRALSTCKIFLEAMGLKVNDVGIVDDLYDFGGQSVLNFIESMDNELNSIMIFGHNHAFTALVNKLGSQYIDNLPTSGLAIIEFEASEWSKIKDGKTDEIIIPKDLKIK